MARTIFSSISDKRNEIKQNDIFPRILRMEGKSRGGKTIYDWLGEFSFTCLIRLRLRINFVYQELKLVPVLVPAFRLPF